MERKCKDCSFYVPEKPEVDYGYCHLEGPAPITKRTKPQWPPVKETDFCGKFELRQYR
ncbi:MAG: hypothetical protein ISS79_01670 [Phycisphaerae bacterium]|nr:hypothetical protein [Phycisphaerae bacterium]